MRFLWIVTGFIAMIWAIVPAPSFASPIKEWNVITVEADQQYDVPVSGSFKYNSTNDTYFDIEVYDSILGGSFVTADTVYEDTSELDLSHEYRDTKGFVVLYDDLDLLFSSPLSSGVDYTTGSFQWDGGQCAADCDTNSPDFDYAGGLDIGFVSSTPLPTALPLFATGLGALGLLGWRRKRKAKAVA
jgi:hypothetical protein